MIPKVIYMCHRDTDYVRKVTIPKWTALNPEYKIELFNDEDCENFLLNEFSELERDIFRFINRGVFKSDFWRMFILYKRGGIYVDADIEPLIPLSEFIDDIDNFATCLSCFAGEFNPHFIMCEAGNADIKQCIDETVIFYKEKMAIQEESVFLTAPKIFEKIFKKFYDVGIYQDGAYLVENYKLKLMKEHYNGQKKYCVYKHKMLLNNKDSEYPKKYD